MVLGAVIAVFSNNLKYILACSSLSQIGFILVGTAALSLLGQHNALAAHGTVLYMMNHSLVKLTLFLLAGVVYCNTHALDLNQIRGYGRGKPLLHILFLCGACSLAGIPGFLGYISKTLVHESLVELAAESGSLGVTAVEWLFLFSGGLTAAYLTKIYAALFWQKPAASTGRTWGTPATTAALILAALPLPVLGLLPHGLAEPAAALALPFVGGHPFGHAVHYLAWENLKGVAISLTIGMAVDANVIIYERIKEELRMGKTLAMSVAEGYKNAMSAIIDGNVTTLITGIVLFIFGTGPVQGFATTLIIGIITSLFTAILITRLIFVGMLNRERKITFSNKFTENFLANTKFNFIDKRKITYVISGIMLLITLVSLGVRGMSYGVDFSGGRAFVVRFDQPVTANEVREALGDVFTGTGYEVKQFGQDNQMRIVTQYKYDDEGDNVTAEIEDMLYKALSPLMTAQLTEAEFLTTAQNPYGIISSDKVGPSVAHDIKVDSVIAVLFSLVAIALYIIIRFKRWQWGVGSVISLTLDALFTIGLFSLLHGLLPFNLEVDQSFIAAILTIIGYSINDKVVIFDRIREYQTLYPKRNIKDNINNAINSTLTRTINTSGTTLVVLLAIFLFGGEVIRGFVFALLFGVLISTYSTVFTATPIAYDLIRRKEPAAK